MVSARPQGVPLSVHTHTGMLIVSSHIHSRWRPNRTAPPPPQAYTRCAENNVICGEQRHVNLSISFCLRFNGHFLSGPGLGGTGIMSPLWILLELRVMEMVSGDNWSYKTCKAPVKISPPTNQHPIFYRPDALPVAHQPTVSEHWREREVLY